MTVNFPPKGAPEPGPPGGGPGCLDAGLYMLELLFSLPMLLWR